MPPNKVWLVGGTSESRTIAQLLTTHSFPVVVTVTTASAEKLYSSNSLLTVIVGKINPEDIIQFIVSQQVKVIVDASHPYACNISQALIAVSQKYQYPYLRYERSSLKVVPTQNNITYVPSIPLLLKNNHLQGQRVLLTIGSRNLHLFKDYQTQATLFTRILPYAESLHQATEAGFTNDRVIAIRPPLTPQFEQSLYQLWQIQTIVTKASGKRGGEEIKQQLAQKLNLRLIIIERPKVVYPQKTENISVIIAFCRKHL